MVLKKFFKFLSLSFISSLLLSTSSNVLAAGNCAFSAGKGYGDVDMSSAVISAYNKYSQMGYRSYYATSGADYATLAGTFQNGTRRLESDIVFLTGHGSSSYVETIAFNGVAITGTDGYYVDIDDIGWNNVKLAIFLSCKTGETNQNIAYKVFEESGWSTVTMGWKQSIEDISAKSWIANFNSKLATGVNIGDALNYANSQSYPDSRVKDISFYGPWDRVMSSSLNLSTECLSTENISINENNITYLTQPKFTFDGTDNSLVNVIDAIKSVDNSFNQEDYVVDIYKITNDGKHYTIEFTYKIGDFYTNSSYVAIINNGYVTQIANNSKSNNLNKTEISTAMDMTATQKIIPFVKKVARNKTLDSNIEIRNQDTRYYLDLETNKKYIQVFSTYGYIGSEAIAQSCYMYEI